MRNKKRRVELLSFYDHTGIERHLARMAREGWLIERMSNFFWTYRRIEPRELHFSASYFSKASDFDPVPSEAQQTMIDLCAQTGWKLACTWFQMQVFYHEGDAPTPIHTEPALEVAAIHRACKANYLRAFGVLLAISLVATLMLLSSLISDTLRLLASPTDLVTGAICALLFAHSLAELTAYFTWHHRAKKAAEYGLFLDTPSTARLQKLTLMLLALCAAYWLVNLLFSRQLALAWLTLAVLLCLAAARAAGAGVKELLKRKNLSSGMNRALTAAASFLVALVLFRTVVFSGAFLISREGTAPPVYSQAPLRIEDLQAPPDDSVTAVSADNSLLLSRLAVDQRHGGEGASSAAPLLHYELYTVKAPCLYDFFEGQLKRLILLPVFRQGTLAREDAAPWGAQEAWRLVLKDGGASNVYLLCLGDMLARVEFSWEPTAAQKAVVGEKLSLRYGFAPLSPA